MSVTANTIPESVSQSDVQLGASLDRLWPELPRFRGLGLAGELADRFLDHVSALRYLLHAGPDRPLLAGLVGGASCGKSTIFGSLVGRSISRIHYQPHSSLGPIVWHHRRHQLGSATDCQPGRFFPQLTLEEWRGDSGPVVGATDRVITAAHEDDRWKHLAILDLPDITSESARREGWVVRHLLPWLDLVIWIVDPNDYLFEDLYNDLIDEVAELGQRSVVVVNDIHGQVAKQSTDVVLQERVERFRPDAWFVLPRLSCSATQPYPLFRNEPEFLRLRSFLESHRERRPATPLVASVRRDATSILRANAEWHRVVAELNSSVTRLVARHRKRILASAPLLSVLPEAAQQELERLRNRFSLWHHGKRLYGAIRNPGRTVGQSAMRQLQLSVEDLDTEPLYRHLVGAMKEFGVDLHHAYLESRFVQRMQEKRPDDRVLGSFEPESLTFKPQLDALARHLFLGAQQMISDPSLLNDRRFKFVLGTTGVALVFLAAQTLLGLVGVTLLFGKGLTALAAVLSPELARFLPLDRMSRLASEARDMLARVLDEQLKVMVEFYTASQGCFIETGDPLLPLLEEVQAEVGVQG